ncbi:Conserved hypothetical protein [Nesidiocoris tenuis]|uniref:Uncharacterized protein n=1 Tax=Nesidiocoris tenuis TaxID=355587 RepID=A0ABN7BEY5_9HEMI|nr:Conserved hypothetical protein [Nesidiocoris tenuis]
MASSIKDTATFFAAGSVKQFEHVLSLYPEALRLKAERKKKKPEELIKLDNWYQNDLPKKIKSRGKDAHLNHEELVQLMKWKQARGKFYPQLNYLVKVNTPRAVMAETKKAFRKLPNLEQAITALSNLKGVGITMASALLAAAAPEMAPFMADECLMAIPEIEGIDYTTKEYMNFVSHIQNAAQRLNKELEKAGNANGTWSPHQVELALWTHYVASEYQPELLDSIPNGTSPPHSNGNEEPHEENSNATSVDVHDVSDESSLDANGKVTESSSVAATDENTNTSLPDPEDLSPLVVNNNQDDDGTTAEPTAVNENDDESSSSEPPSKKAKPDEPVK